MTNVPNTANQQAQTPEETRQQMLSSLDASKERVGELNDQELEAVSGGGAGFAIMMTAFMGGGGAGGGTGGGSTAANSHKNIVNNHNASAAQSSNGDINIGNTMR